MKDINENGVFLDYDSLEFIIKKGKLSKQDRIDFPRWPSYRDGISLDYGCYGGRWGFAINYRSTTTSGARAIILADLKYSSLESMKKDARKEILRMSEKFFDGRTEFLNGNLDELLNSIKEVDTKINFNQGVLF